MQYFKIIVSFFKTEIKPIHTSNNWCNLRLCLYGPYLYLHTYLGYGPQSWLGPGSQWEKMSWWGENGDSYSDVDSFPGRNLGGSLPWCRHCTVSWLPILHTHFALIVCCLNDLADLQILLFLNNPSVSCFQICKLNKYVLLSKSNVMLWYRMALL